MRSEVTKRIRPAQRKHLNKFRASPGETKAHVAGKQELFDLERSKGHDVICEPRLLEVDERPDILVLDTATVIEVAVTESDDSLQRKRILYERLGFKFHAVRRGK